MRLSQAIVHRMQVETLVKEVRALRTALAAADELEQAAEVSEDDDVIRARARYRVARKKVPS